MNNNRFRFGFSEQEKTKKSLDELLISARGNKDHLIALASAVVGIKHQQMQQKRA